MQTCIYKWSQASGSSADHEQEGKQLAEDRPQGQLHHVGGAQNKVGDLIADPFDKEHHGSGDPQLEKLAPASQRLPAPAYIRPLVPNLQNKHTVLLARTKLY